MALQTGQSHSWWFASKDRLQSSTTQSPWLSLTLSELEERIKQMLNLMEEDADSFAERAEMYYKKRPQLMNMIEDFYRAHRSLAEQYDQLKSSLAVRRSTSVLPSYLDKSWSQSMSNTEPDEEHKSSSDPFDSEGSEVDDPEQVENKLRETPDEGTASYLVEQNDELVEKLKDELERLKEENAKLKAEILGKNEETEAENKLREMPDEGTASHLLEQNDELVVKLKDELEGLKEENAKLKAEIAGKNEEIEVENKLSEMPDEGTASYLLEQKDKLIVKLIDELEGLKEENAKLKADTSGKNEETGVENKLKEMPDEGTASYLVEQKDKLIAKLKDELEGLREENAKLKADIAGKNEETEVENMLREMPVEKTASYLEEQKDELVAKLKHELEGLKEENGNLKAEIAGKNDETKVENKLREMPDEGTASYLVEPKDELAEKLKDELEALKEEHAKLKAEIAGKNEETEVETKLREIPDEGTTSYLVEQKDELVVKLKDELEGLKEENAKLKAEIARKNKEPEVENKLREMPDELTASYLVEQNDELAEKLKDELEGLKEENAKLKAEIVAKNEEKREVIRQLALSLEILKEENLTLRMCIKESENDNCIFDLKKLSGRLFAGISSKFQSTIVAL